MILDITSFGWSGSGAYHDLLREYDQTEFPSSGDWEFCLLWDVDGIYDLDHQLCTKSCRIYDSDMAIHRFLNRIKMMMKTPIMGYSSVFKKGFLETRSKQYIESLVDIKFQGRAFNDWIYPTKFDGIIQKYNRILEFCICNRISRKIFPHNFLDLLINYNPHEFYVSYKPASFLRATQDYLQDLIDYTRKDSHKVYVSDQMLPPDNPEPFYKYIREPLKSVIVRRDPRDTYIAMKKASSFPYPIPRDIDQFIWFYKNVIAGTKLPDSENRISLNFEDLIYKYDETINKIESFVNLGRHVSPKAKFDPEISKNNTQLDKLYPEYTNDIKKIEKELGEFLYPYEKFEFHRTSNKIF